MELARAYSTGSLERARKASTPAVENDDTHYIVEVKMQKEMRSADVLAKRTAAKRWVNHVNKSAKVKPKWNYLLVGEDDVKTATGSWTALKKLAS